MHIHTHTHMHNYANKVYKFSKIIFHPLLQQFQHFNFFNKSLYSVDCRNRMYGSFLSICSTCFTASSNNALCTSRFSIRFSIIWRKPYGRNTWIKLFVKINHNFTFFLCHSLFFKLWKYFKKSILGTVSSLFLLLKAFYIFSWQYCYYCLCFQSRYCLCFC